MKTTLTYSLLLIMLLFKSFDLIAQNELLSVKVIDHETAEPLLGATIYIQALSKGTSTNKLGIATIKNLQPGKYILRVSSVGYNSNVQSVILPLNESILIIELHQDEEELEKIIVSATRSSRTINDQPTRVEYIAGEELSEKANMKPGDIRMVLSESTGIQTQQTSATSYNSSIRIQGLDGRYTQLLRDGLPLYSGFSGGLSLMQIAPLDLQQVEVIKGSSSTLYGGGAIAGLVNLVTKKPSYEAEWSTMLNATSALGVDVSSFYRNRDEKFGTTIFASYNRSTPYDPANIGLTAIPYFERITFNPRLFGYHAEKTDWFFGFNLVAEERLGGDMDVAETKNRSLGYFENNTTFRVSSQFQLNHRFTSETQLQLKNSVSFFDREIQLPNVDFSGIQWSSFSEINLKRTRSSSEVILGFNLWTDIFEQRRVISSMALDQEDIIYGAFSQYTVDLSDIWAFEGGVRLDHHQTYGSFFLPRLAIMANPSSQLTFRWSASQGYKAPTIFTEEAERIQFQGIWPLNTENLVAETSIGTQFDINTRFSLTDELTLSTNILFFYTQIDKPLLLQQVDSRFSYKQPEGTIDTRGFEMNMKWTYDHFKLFVGYTYADVNQELNNTNQPLPLVAKHQLNNVLMYEKHGEFWIGLEAYFFSEQLLSDGSKGKPYWITGLMSEKKINETVSIFLNFENFLDTRQTAFDTIFSGSVSNPQFREIYAPVDGFVINGGVKLSL